MKFKRFIPFVALAIGSGALISGIITYSVILRQKSIEDDKNKNKNKVDKFKEKSLFEIVNDKKFFSSSLSINYISKIYDITLGKNALKTTQELEKAHQDLTKRIKEVIKLKTEAFDLAKQMSKEAKYKDKILGADLEQLSQIIDEIKNEEKN
ncbi:hypothetical protein NPA08_03310 [Mycoplasmopsis citelli]|uniref:hypothetical protein n=1 Tax=Mycoplasmopsis citelli TaxID=171281 RepID=UPI002115A943|nr:hypothetical protein [Mycoplasmopsis citelli]UUD35960.1 hypothetical protein NPA08_03310 [Mycoplasmopsis citelli]